MKKNLLFRIQSILIAIIQLLLYIYIEPQHRRCSLAGKTPALRFFSYEKAGARKRSGVRVPPSALYIV